PGKCGLEKAPDVGMTVKCGGTIPAAAHDELIPLAGKPRHQEARGRYPENEPTEQLAVGSPVVGAEVESQPAPGRDAKREHARLHDEPRRDESGAAEDDERGARRLRLPTCGARSPWSAPDNPGESARDRSARALRPVAPG